MRVGELLRANEIDITSVLRLPYENDEAILTPLITPLMEPEEVPEELLHTPAPKQKARDHLPEPRVTRSRQIVSATAASVRLSGEDQLVFAIKVAAAKTSVPAVHEALRSPMREGRKSTPSRTSPAESKTRI